MARYKATIRQVKGEKTDKEMGKIPEGSWYLKVLFKCTEKFNTDHETWEDISLEDDMGQPKDLLFSKRYFLSHDITSTDNQGRTRTLFESSMYFLEKDLGFSGDASHLQEKLMDMEVEIITYTNERGYEDLKYINRPGGRKPLVKAGEEEDFASVFNKR